MRLLLLLVVMPIVELYLLVKLSNVTGWPFTILLTIVTGIAGSSLARHQGWKTFNRIQEEMAGGRMPTQSLVDAFMILAAGLLLMTPGIITDCFGFSLLVPFFRGVYRNVLMSWFKKNARVQTFQNGVRMDGVSMDGTGRPKAATSDQVIDSYVVDKDGKRIED